MTRQIAVAVLSAVVISAAGILCGCRKDGITKSEKGYPMPAKSIEQVLKENTDPWMGIDGVEGTATGLHKGKPCIKIFTSVKAQELRGKIPSAVDGYPVIIEETGEFRALDQK
jgi:hypothetical protein